MQASQEQREHSLDSGRHPGSPTETSGTCSCVGRVSPSTTPRRRGCTSCAYSSARGAEIRRSRSFAESQDFEDLRVTAADVSLFLEGTGGGESEQAGG